MRINVTGYILRLEPTEVSYGSDSLGPLELKGRASNQGDGSVSRVDEKSKHVTRIQVGIPGTGGDIGYGADSVWLSVFDVPLTRIDATTNRVIKQWIGKAEILSASGSIRSGLRTTRMACSREFALKNCAREVAKATLSMALQVGCILRRSQIPGVSSAQKGSTLSPLTEAPLLTRGTNMSCALAF
jgi:hypothetical protein